MSWFGGTPNSQKYGPTAQRSPAEVGRDEPKPVSGPPAPSRVDGVNRFLARRFWIVPAEAFVWAPLILFCWVLAIGRIAPLTVLDLWYVPVQVFWAGLLALLIVGTSVAAWRTRELRIAAGNAPLVADPAGPPAGNTTQRSVPRALAIFAALTAAPVLSLLYPMYARPESGRAAPWSTQLAFAQLVASREDSAALVESVSADPIKWSQPNPPIDENTAFELDFVFRRPDGSSMRVEIADVDPPRLIGVDNHWDYVVLQSAADTAAFQAQLDRDRTTLAFITLSPRDVYQRTLTEGIAFGKQYGGWPQPHAQLFLGHDWQQRGWGVPTGWNMQYDAGGKSINLRVNPQTGQVIAREPQ